MSDLNNSPASPLNTGALLRASADGELNAGDRARLDAMIAAEPELARRAEFENRLRTCCGRVMERATCPDALRMKIEAMAAGREESFDDGESSAASAGAGDRGVVSAASQTRERSFWAGGRPRTMLALAATVLLSLSAVLVWQSVVLTRQSALPTGGSLIAASYRQELAEFITKEHTRTESSESARASKFVYTDPESAQRWFAGLIGDKVTLAPLSQPIEAIEFKGAGKCGVPGSAYGKSAHLQFEVVGEGDGPIVVSVFAAPRNDKVKMEAGTTYAVDLSSCGIEGYGVLAWTDGIANYFLVADSETGGCAATMKAMGKGEPTEEL